MFLSVSALLLAASALTPVKAGVFTVTVGGSAGLVYTPSTVNASVGDVIQFQFQQKNHTATQSSFANPCSPLSNGFDSSFMPVGANVTSGFPTFNYTVESTNPVWIYCRQTGHCAQGMVFAINAGQDQFNSFKAAAIATGNATSTTSVPPLVTATPSVVTVTETVTAASGNVWTTTYGSYPGSAAPTNAVAQTYLITVGENGTLTFNPNDIQAQPGDTVSFRFVAKNHTVTQSSFAQPCRGLAAATGKDGFDSGFMPVAANATSFPTFNISINDTAPIWVYCRQTNHCGQGMVMAINAIDSSANSFTAFQARAMQLNGTATSTATSPSATKSSASRHLVTGTGIILSVVTAIFCLVL